MNINVMNCIFLDAVHEMSCRFFMILPEPSPPVVPQRNMFKALATASGEHQDVGQGIERWSQVIAMCGSGCLQPVDAGGFYSSCCQNHGARMVPQNSIKIAG